MYTMKQDWYYTAKPNSDQNFGEFENREIACSEGVREQIWDPVPDQRVGYFYVFSASPKVIHLAQHFNIEDWWKWKVEGELKDEFWEETENPQDLRTFAPHREVESLKGRMNQILDAWQKEYKIVVKTGHLIPGEHFKVSVVRTSNYWAVEDVVKVDVEPLYGRER